MLTQQTARFDRSGAGGGDDTGRGDGSGDDGGGGTGEGLTSTRPGIIQPSQRAVESPLRRKRNGGGGGGCRDPPHFADGAKMVWLAAVAFHNVLYHTPDAPDAWSVPRPDTACTFDEPQPVWGSPAAEARYRSASTTTSDGGNNDNVKDNANDSNGNDGDSDSDTDNINNSHNNKTTTTTLRVMTTKTYVQKGR